MRWCSVLFLAAALVAVNSGHAEVADTQLWWKSAVLYQVYPRSFKDSDGDGVGDLKGITQMAGYFKELGVDALWLSPIYPSPLVDFGYDISDFTNIDPIFGTMDDFDALVATCKKLDLKILLDFVPNHSSDQHEWFKKSVQNDTDYRDFYLWEDPTILPNGTRVPPNNWNRVFVGSAWEWNEQRQQYYLHQFAPQQPDFNFRNPAVQGNMTAVINFWLDKGVDGFRIDAVQFMYEDKYLRDEPVLSNGNSWYDLRHIYTMNQPETLTVLRNWADVVYDRVQQDGRPKALLLEVYADPKTAAQYFGQGKENLAFPFYFGLMRNISQSIRAPEIKSIIDNWTSQVPKGGQLNWAVGNHDNMRVADRYGPEMVDAINLLTGVLPGIKVVYYGEEIGMTNTYVLWDETVDPEGRVLGPNNYQVDSRDPERTPMQWDDSVSAGFSTNHTTWLPVNPNYWWLNVNAQRNSDNSHMKVFQKLAKARKDPVLQFGDLNVIAPDNNTLLVTRTYQGSSFVLLINMGSKSRTYNSQDFFAPYNLDASMYVVVSSVNAAYYSSGKFMHQGSLSVTLRPKAAILLTTKTWTPSPTPSGAPRLSISLLLAFTMLFLSLKTYNIYNPIRL